MIAAMSFITLPDLFLHRALHLLAGADRDALVLAYPELAVLDHSVPLVWLDVYNRHVVVTKSQARLQAMGFPGPYTDAMLQDHVSRWCGQVFRNLKGNEFHAADDHLAEFEQLGSLQSNLLH